MFDYLYTEAYAILRQEIESIAKEILSDDNDDNAVYNLYYAGQLHAMNAVVTIMNKVDEDLYASLLRESEKEAAYYESELSADESCYKQL